MAQILQPKILGDTTVDSWSISVAESNNELDSRVGALESGEIILTSPDGSRFRLTVSNTGVLSTTRVE